MFVEDALADLAKGSNGTTATASNGAAGVVASNGATTASTSLDVVPMAVVDTTTATSTTPPPGGGGGPYASLADSTGAKAAWAKILKILINSRMAGLKAVDSVQSWYPSPSLP